jgi:hypothetical protein
MEKIEKMVLKYDYTTEIVVTKRTDDYHACIRGHPEIWGCGRNESEAIGDVIRSHESEFDIKVQYGRKEHKYGIYVVRCLNCGLRKYIVTSPIFDIDMVKHYDTISKCCDKPYYHIIY